MSLFESEERQNRISALPLAARMRPISLNEFVGQQHFLGPGKLLRRLLKADRLGSVIFCGPPGTGKTTLAWILSRESRSTFKQLSAVSDGVKQLREVLLEARDRLAVSAQRTLLFIDEIHRFNKSQQDVLLPEVEQGVVILVGATTENPYFTINNALLSRSRVFQFEPLGSDDIKTLISRAATDSERGLGRFSISLHEDALDYMAEISDGDARRALSTLEVGILSSLEDDEKAFFRKGGTKTIEFTRELAAESVQKRIIGYDRDGDTHYDTISALIKSIRGSDPDAAIYWLARMLEGGEDFRFLARRLVILASEDVGNADPAALPLAVATAQACEMVGLPECKLNLAQAVTYLACAPKSNAATTAIFAAIDDMKNGRIVPVPRHLRDSHYKGSANFGHVGYQYAHNFDGGVVSQEYLGVDREYYTPTDRGFEKELGLRLAKIRAILHGQKENEASESAGDEKKSNEQESSEVKTLPKESSLTGQEPVGDIEIDKNIDKSKKGKSKGN
ncbi:MAG: replication-associated recombination protein A [Planctomycetia bacterium]|nr:replication-associated recombination protein A [Planctomycetia bacterium]